MAAGATMHKPRAKSLWLLVRRVLCRGSKMQRPAAEELKKGDDGGEKSSLLGRSGSLEELLGSDVVAGAVRLGSAKTKDVQHVLLPSDHRQRQPADVARPEAALAVTSAGRAGGAAMQQYRRFVFGGFRRRLMMRRPWRPMLVAIPE
uniref:Uncharacterized protein n=1 Tax=Avena sativa TaxID=4498 RepID=A0ACD5VKQ6_AVESA